MSKQKDPALLWYWDNWNSGTMLLSRHQKGCYIDLLHAQFNNGHLSLEEIKICLGADFGQQWPALQKKFKKDENSLYYNERMDIEIAKRGKFKAHQSESGKNGAKKRWDKHRKNGNPISDPISDPNGENIAIGNGDGNGIVIKELGSELVQKTAKEVWGDQFWKENTCMAESIQESDLRKWMAKYNASICNDKIHDFGPSKYKKMFGGWLSVQKQKGYTVSGETKQNTQPSVTYKPI